MNQWSIIYDKWEPKEEPLQEALCTLGNGYFATRGAAEENKAGGVHYPGTYLAGGYNRLESEISGRIIENEDLANWPNWLILTFRPEDGDWLDLDSVEVLAYHKELDLRRGILERKVRLRDHKNRETSLTSRRIVHMADPHLAAIEWTLVPENWSGKIEVQAALDGTVINAGVERYQELNSRHLEPEGANRLGEDSVSLVVRTNQSRLEMAQAARLRLYHNNAQIAVERHTIEERGYVAQEVSVNCERQHPIRIEKIVSLYTCRDAAIAAAKHDAERAILRAGSFPELLEAHVRAWAQLWHRCDIEIGADQQVQPLLRLHIFHLLQTVSMNTIDLDVGVPSRGLHGEAYRGHIFWDELFIFPFLNLRIPELTRSVKMYRHRRLPEARQAAKEAGYRGAMYPWQSGSNGREESQVLHLNPESGKWTPDNTHLQRHIICSNRVKRGNFTSNGDTHSLGNKGSVP